MCQKLSVAVKRILPLVDKNKISDNDILFRFLISNAWDVERSTELLHEYVEWRREWDVDSLDKYPFHPELPVKGTYCGYAGVCKAGYPIYWERFVTSGIEWYLSNVDTDELMKWHLYTAERGRELYKGLGTDRVTIVLDCAHLDGLFLLSNFTATSFLRDTVAVDQTRFPEHMYKLFLINCSWGFNFLWKWVKVFLKDSVVKDIHVLTGSNFEDIAEFIDLGAIPEDFGGTAPALERLTASPQAWQGVLQRYDAVDVPATPRTQESAVAISLARCCC